MRNLGYKELSLSEHDASLEITGKIFYQIPVSMENAKKEKILLRAFDQGAIVIMDEINSIPCSEKFFNDLRMGIRPESEVSDSVPHKNSSKMRRPKHPGFMILGTQNPSNRSEEFANDEKFEGRYEESAASKARMMPSIIMRNYDHDELILILTRRKNSLTFEEANVVVECFESQVKSAKDYGYKPQPTFRDLENLADSIYHENQLKKIGIEIAPTRAKVSKRKDPKPEDRDNIEQNNVANKKGEIAFFSELPIRKEKNRECINSLLHAINLNTKDENPVQVAKKIINFLKAINDNLSDPGSELNKSDYDTIKATEWIKMIVDQYPDVKSSIDERFSESMTIHPK